MIPDKSRVAITAGTGTWLGVPAPIARCTLTMALPHYDTPQGAVPLAGLVE